MVNPAIRWHWLVSLLGLIWALAFVPNAEAAVVAQLDRATINSNETVNLSVTVSDGDEGEPNLNVLQADFDILSRQQSSSYQWINGKNNSSKTWQLVLQPKRIGQLTIPPIPVGNKQTQALKLLVTDAAAQAAQGNDQRKLWMELSMQPQSAMVQQQLIVSLKIYQGIQLNQAQLSDLQVEHAVVKTFEKDLQYQQARNGRMWNVTERRYAVFPQQHGTLTIPVVELNGNVQVQANRGFFPTLQPIRVRSNPLSVDVQGIPASWPAGQPWLPATKVSLMEDWPTNQSFKVGEPITRTVSLRADGALGSQLPELPELQADGLKVYPEKPEFSTQSLQQGMLGIRIEKQAIIPTWPGQYVLPAMEVNWWNTATNSMEVARVPARTFTVQAATAPAGSSASTTSQAVTPAEPQQAAPAEQPSAVASADAGLWKTVALIAIAGWLLTLVAWFWQVRCRKPRSSSASASKAADINTLRQQIEQACEQNDAKACEQAVLAYAAAHPATQQSRSLAVLQQAVGEPLKFQLQALEAHRYGQDPFEWDGSAMLEAFSQTLWPEPANETKQGLPPLYPG